LDNFFKALAIGSALFNISLDTSQNRYSLSLSVCNYSITQIFGSTEDLGRFSANSGIAWGCVLG
jgi:hypothetical protein